LEASAVHAPAGLSRPRLPLPPALLRLRSDDQLVALFRSGNEEAFRAIHDRYRARLLAYACQMFSGSRQDAEDVLQDVFVRAYAALRSDGRALALRPWLYRVAHNRCVDQLRRPTPPVAELTDTAPGGVDPCAETEAREDLRRLVVDVQRLPEQQRSALLMREMNGLAYMDIADALDVTTPAVKSLLVRARMGLAQAGEARDTACSDIRGQIAEARGRGVRASGQARRHVRDCSGCRAYRDQLRGAHRQLAALAPAAGPLALLAKLLGLGGASGGAGAGALAGSSAGAGAGAGAGAIAGSGAAAGTVTVAATASHVAAVMAVAAVAAGGAVEVEHHIQHTRHHAAPKTIYAAPAPARVAHVAPAAPAPAAPVGRRPVAAPPADPAKPDDASPATPTATPDPSTAADNQNRTPADPEAATDATATDPKGDPVTQDPPATIDPAAPPAPATGTTSPPTTGAVAAGAPGSAPATTLPVPPPVTGQGTPPAG
jgi:RNA polymerase sigma factor (sigma-70 family)